MEYDILVVGGGHAGAEAALAAARLGCRTALLVFSREAVCRLSCNPSVGGIAKGQLVREIDALGGEMGLASDRTGIHFRMLNVSKGPAVQSPRAQVDKHAYARHMLGALEASGCVLVEGEATGMLVSGSRLAGVLLAGGLRLAARRVVLAAGTFLDGLIHRGRERVPAGRIGEPAAAGLAADLRRLGLRTGRLKTGTPMRVAAGSLEFARMQVQPPDPEPRPFSFRTERIGRPAVPCHVTWTTPVTHAVIRDHLDEVPLYNGQIQGVGPRYCPSIEAKVQRFPDKERHQVFVEPESLETDEVYLAGLSSSMSAERQEEFLRTIPGLERARVLRWGYAIEYDFCPPEQLFPGLESRLVPGLFLAGQVNGTTGYEEAAAQGLVAGINAVLSLRGEAPCVPGREEAYLGVLLDDLATKEIDEPYRLFTSRAEHRLVLRHDNADERLMGLGRRLGLVAPEVHERMLRRYEAVRRAEAALERRFHEGASLARLLRDPRQDLDGVAALPGAPPELAALDAEGRRSLEVRVKYAGYLERERRRVERGRRQEEELLPESIDYLAVGGISREAREKLARFRPRTVGQAGRIAGVSPADLQVLDVLVRGRRWPLRGDRG